MCSSFNAERVARTADLGVTASDELVSRIWSVLSSL
jgi:hypothetical protein